MKRRQILKLLGLAPPLLLTSCGDPKVPSAPTIATGKVIDENNMPIEGVSIGMFGLERRGVSAIATFDIDALTDKDGHYSLSFVVPRGTDFVKVSAEGNSIFSDRTHNILFQRGGIYEEGDDYELHIESYGKTNTVNYQFIKR